MKIKDIFEDEDNYPYKWNEKLILWDNGEYYIATGNSTNTYLTVWTSENKNVGLLDSSIINKGGSKRAKINMVKIQPVARGNRLGLVTYYRKS